MNRDGLVNGVQVCCTLTAEQATVSYGPDLCLVFHPAFPEDARAAFEALCRVKQVQVPPLTLDQYQAEVTRTCAASTGAETLKLALIGLIGELGEISEPLKKHLWGGHVLEVAPLQEEVGDLLWYLATLCNALDLRLQQAMQGNVSKLQARYPNGFAAHEQSS